MGRWREGLEVRSSPFSEVTQEGRTQGKWVTLGVQGVGVGR